MSWIENSSVLRFVSNKLDDLSSATRIASFDLDDTIIVRELRSKDSDIVLVSDVIIKQIKILIENNYLVVIFTNQGGMSRGKNFNFINWKKKIENLYNILFRNISNKPHYFALYAAKKYNLYRKPNTGMWQLMRKDLEKKFGKTHISTRSFFIGDAAGRITPSPLVKKYHPSAKCDFSDVDRKFASNIKINFYTPDQFYNAFSSDINDLIDIDNILESKKMEKYNIEYSLKGFNPNSYVKNLEEKISKGKKISLPKFTPREKELIVMVGIPGSGKSSFVKEYIIPHKYIRINMDELKTTKKCIDKTIQNLTKGKNIVIDNTNLDIESRMKYTTIAKKYGYENIRCIVMNTDIDIAVHMNNVRHIYSEGEVPLINKIAYHRFKKYVPADFDENFDKIEEVNFVLDMNNFEDLKWKKAFFQYSEAL